MAGNSHHVEIGGEKYWLAQGDEGAHFSEHGEPLRPPNSVPVQGENNKFQSRPDKLIWSLTDWSGGEGFFKFSDDTPNGWKQLNAVRVFDFPGKLKPGYHIEATKDSGGSSDLAVPGFLVRAKENLYLLSASAANAYLWDDTNKKWGAATSLTGVSNGAAGQVAGDHAGVYWIEKNTDNLWFWSGSGAPTLLDDVTGMTASGESHTAVIGGKVLNYRCGSDLVWETSKAGNDVLAIDDFDDGGIASYFGGAAMAPMDGKVYVMVTHEDRTEVREITPTTAAGTGFGAEIAKFMGFRGFGIWAHAGIIYLIGDDGQTGNHCILYLTPGGEYGSLGNIRPGDSVKGAASSPANASMLKHYVALEQLDSTAGRMAVLEINSTNGAFAALGIADANAAGSSFQGVASCAFYRGQVFWSTTDTTTDRVFRADPTRYTVASSAISPWHDFNLADDKILTSLTLSMEPLPANWTVNVDYAIDGSTSWTAGITDSTTSSKGSRTQISTGSSTIKFGTLAIRIRMTYTGGGIPTTSPVILGVDAAVMTASKQKVLTLRLSLEDPKSRNQQYAGSKKAANIRTLGDAGNVVTVVDCYTNRNARTTYSMVIDEYEIAMDHPGEGWALVVLKEST